MSSGFGTNDKKDINELIKKIDSKINSIRSDFNKDVTLLKNQLNTCSTELNRLKELIQDVTDYTASEYEKLERKTAEFEAALDDIRSRLNTIQYNQVQGGKCASGINEFPIYARYAEKDINGADITATYATKTELNNTSATLSGDYTQKIAESSSSGMSALSSVSAQLNNAINAESLRASNAEEALDVKIDDEITERRVECAELEDRIGAEEQARETAIGDLQTSLQEEETTRELADDTIQTNLVAETTAREQADAELQNNLDDEISRATAKETELDEKIDTVSGNLFETITNVSGELNTAIENEANRAVARETELDEKIDTNYELLDTALSAEVERAKAEDRDLYNYIDEVVENTNSAINDLENAIDTTSANLTDTINAETTRATNEENRLAGLLGQEIVDRINAITDAKNELGTLIAEEETTRISADSTLQTNIESEASLRTNADNNLQSQIDTIEATQNVVDIVGTKAELDAYQTSALQLNDKIQVLTDETQNDATTIYNWNSSLFVLVGTLGPYYTKAEVDTTIEELSNTVESGFERLDSIDTLLSGNIDYVSAGVTALSNDLHTNYYDITNTSSKSELETAFNLKQNNITVQYSNEIVTINLG